MKIKQQFIILVSFLFIMLFSFVSSQQVSLPPQRLNTCVNLVQTHPNATIMQVTRVNAPWGLDSDIKSMSTTNNYDWNYTYCNLTSLGSYIITTCGDGDGAWDCLNYNFPVTATGTILETPEAIIYVILMIVILLFLGLGLYFSIAIPYSNEVNSTGAVIKISRKKYLKLLAISVTYGLFLLFLNLSVGLSGNYISLNNFYGTLSFFFTTFMWLSWGVILFILVLFIFEIFHDSILQKDIFKYGYSARK